MADELEVMTQDALGVITRQEVDLQINAAHKFTRNIAKAQAGAMQMACIDTATALSCRYALPRGGKAIEGPSVRLAEIVASSWGNLRIATRVIEIGKKWITCQCVIQDLERNNIILNEVKRRITNKQGKRYNDDMITMTANAAMSIAYRNAVLRVIPKGFWGPVESAAMDAARKTSVPLPERRRKALAWFESQGIKASQVVAKLGVEALEDITAMHILTLQGYCQAIADGELTIETLFNGPEVDEDPEPKPKPQDYKYEVVDDKKEKTDEAEECEALWGVWKALLKKLSGPQLDAIKASTGVHRITQKCTVDEMNLAVDAGEKALEGK